MNALRAFLDRPLSPITAGLILVAVLFVFDVALVGVAVWVVRARRLCAWLADVVLGAEGCTAGDKSLPFFAYVPMPEGDYLAKITFRPYTYRRRRWFPFRVLRAHVVMNQPIPIPPPPAIDVKGSRRRVNEDQAVYFVMVPNAPDITAAALYVREYALKLRAEFVFTNGVYGTVDPQARRANART